MGSDILSGSPSGHYYFTATLRLNVKATNRTVVLTAGELDLVR